MKKASYPDHYESAGAVNFRSRTTVWSRFARNDCKLWVGPPWKSLLVTARGWPTLLRLGTKRDFLWESSEATGITFKLPGRSDVMVRLIPLLPRRTRFDSRRGGSQIFVCGNRAGRCRWSAIFLGNLPFLPPFHSSATQYSPHFALIGSQDLDALLRSHKPIELPVQSRSLLVKREGKAISSISDGDNYVEIFADSAMTCAISTLASHQSEPGTIPGRFTPDFRKWESCRTIPLVGGFSPPPKFPRRYIFTSITLIGSKDLTIKSHPNPFAH
ncbi:hypothetical protein PR048_015672 [Dryococelus australis]|uniref:Uncharacterized protein n=1 Tax=Dryococelus australis TaxID=614101 RepID=A0ABQ9HHL2_9NEOP|nr:hypothetical protein PR048_015672 [Dryococelus australis]